MSKFLSVVEAEKQNGGPQKKRPLEENKTPASRSNQEHGIDQDIKRLKGVESHPVAIFFLSEGKEFE